VTVARLRSGSAQSSRPTRGSTGAARKTSNTQSIAPSENAASPEAATEQQTGGDISSRQTRPDQGRLAPAQAKFDPVARLLARLSEEIESRHGRPAASERQTAVEQTAENVYAVRYSLRHLGEAHLSLTFLLVAEHADRLPLQRHDLARPRGRVDQRVYRLEEIEEIKAAVKETIALHLGSQLRARSPR
jgi:hypothetical protein